MYVRTLKVHVDVQETRLAAAPCAYTSNNESPKPLSNDLLQRSAGRLAGSIRYASTAFQTASLVTYHSRWHRLLKAFQSLHQTAPTHTGTLSAASYSTSVAVLPPALSF